MGWGRTQSVGNFLQGGVTGNSIVWVRDVGPFVVNNKEVREGTHGVPATDHGEASEASRRQDMGDAGGRRRTRGIRDLVGEDPHRETVGNRGAVSGATSLF